MPFRQLYLSINKGSLMSVGDGSVAQNNRKIVVLDDNTIKQWNLISQYTMDDIAFAKYSQSKIGKLLLSATKNAELWHLVSRG
jgi:starvation-inducible outer membrane lipoprotein